MLWELFKAALKMQRGEEPSDYYWAERVDNLCYALFESGVSERTVNAVLVMAYWKR